MRVHRAGQVVFDHRGRCAASELDQVAGMPGDVASGAGPGEHEVDRRSGMDAVCDPQHGAFARQRGIETREDLVGAVEPLCEEVRFTLAALRNQIRKRAQFDAFAETGEVRERCVEASVDEDQARRGHMRDCSGADRLGIGVCCESAAFERAQRGVFPGFAARAGEAVAQDGIKRGTACGVAFESGCKRVEQGSHATCCRKMVVIPAKAGIQ